MYDQVCMSACPNVYMCIVLTFTSTLGGGEIKGVLNHSPSKSRASSNFTWYDRVYYITPVQS